MTWRCGGDHGCGAAISGGDHGPYLEATLDHLRRAHAGVSIGEAFQLFRHERVDG